MDLDESPWCTDTSCVGLLVCRRSWVQIPGTAGVCKVVQNFTKLTVFQYHSLSGTPAKLISTYELRFGSVRLGQGLRLSSADNKVQGQVWHYCRPFIVFLDI